ncbi:unnamed protein product [Sphagnum jensenii]|uniref:Uncharacterized protein n=1 Tax=Sphagnum jensenii TaxID=128206 RepID=A0ABP1C2P8_9BRYO
MHKSACITVKGSRRGRGGGCCKRREQETITSCFHEGNNSLHVIMVAGEPSRDLIWQSSYCISWASVAQTLCSLPVLADAYRRLGVSLPPLVHNVAPMSGAWKGEENKLKILADAFNHLLCILPLWKLHNAKLMGLAQPILGTLCWKDAFTTVAVCTS